MKTPLRAFLSTLVLSLSGLPLAAACSSDEHGHDEELTQQAFCQLPTVCQDIVVACHPKDTGEKGDINDCHEIGHDQGTVEACAPAHDRCVELCNDAPSLGRSSENWNCSDGGATDGSVMDGASMDAASGD